MRSLLTSTLLAATLAAPVIASGHTAWLEPGPDAGGFTVLFGGHEGKTEAYAADKVTDITAFDTKGASLAVATRTDDDGVVHAVPEGEAALLALHFDNGYWSRGADGASINVPMNANPGATQGTQAIKYAKTVVTWGEAATRALGQPYEVVPLDAEPPRAGRPLRVRVLLDGEPLAGAPVAIDENATPDVTGPDGVATFMPVRGRNVLWSGLRQPLQDDARATVRSYEFLLVFEGL